MRWNICLILSRCILLSLCLAKVSVKRKEKMLNNDAMVNSDEATSVKYTADVPAEALTETIQNITRDDMVIKGCPKDPKYVELAHQSMEKYLRETGNWNLHKVVNIDRVTEQLVSGSIIKIWFTISPIYEVTGDVRSCFAEIWDQSYLGRDINVTCVIDNVESREKRQLTGGEIEQNPKDPKYIKMAKESMEKYLQQAENFNPHKIVSIDKVITQLVSGLSTRILFTIMREDNIGDMLRCVSEVWEQPWLKKKDINVSCEIETK